MPTANCQRRSVQSSTDGTVFLEAEVLRLAGSDVDPADTNSSIIEDSDDEGDFASELFGR